MTFLPSLFNKVEHFVKIAEFYELISRAAQSDPELYSELVQAASEVVNPEVSYTLQILADMYQKALSINGGFNVLYRTIEGIVQDLDPDEEESDQVENLLNKIGSSIRLRARQTDSPQAMREMQNAASEAKRRLAEQAPDVPEEEEESDEVSAYEAALMGDYETPEKMFEGEGGVAKFDPTGGVKPEEAAQGKGRGYSVGKVYTPKDWAQVYANELAKYTNDLNGDDSTVTRAVRTARQDQRVRSNLEDLVGRANRSGILQELINKTKRILEIEHRILLETEVRPHPLEEERNRLQGELATLNEQRVNRKRRLGALYKEAELENLRNQHAAATDTRLKFVLEQKIRLQELRLSGKKGYGQESKERQRLIDSLTADPNLPLAEVQKQEAGIQKASLLTDKITKAMYDRSITEERGKEQAREKTPEYEATRGGARVPMKQLPEEEQIDLEKASFSALVYQFQIDIASATQAARQAIYRAESGGGGSRKAKAKENPEYKRIIDEISDAIRKKDRTTLYAAQNKLVAAVTNDANVAKNQLKGYVDVLQLEPHFRKVLESIKELTKNKKGAPPKMSEGGELLVDTFTDQDKEDWRFILNDIHRLRTLYTKYYMDLAGMRARHVGKAPSEWWTIKQQITPRFRKVIEDMGRIQTHLALKLGVHPPPKKTLYPKKSPGLQEILKEDLKKKKSISSRMDRLGRILFAQTVQEIVPEQEIDEATADRLANELFDKVFDETYQRVFSELHV